MPEREIQEWMIWEEEHGILGARRGDIQASSIALEITSVLEAAHWNNPRKRSLADCLPLRLNLRPQEKQQTAEEQIAILKALSGASRKAKREGNRTEKRGK